MAGTMGTCASRGDWLGTEARRTVAQRPPNCSARRLSRMSTTATSTWVLADLLRQSASPPALRLCGHEYPLLLLLTGPFSSPTDHHRSCCLRYQLSGCCNGSYRKDLAPNVDPAFRRRYFRRRRSTRPELYAMNTRRSTRPLCLVWRLPRRGGVLGICSTWQCHSTSLLSLPRLASSR